MFKMHRDHLNTLKEWRIHPQRKPLLIRGARQVGKSWLVDEFGKHFDTTIKINFEQEKGAHILFEGDLLVERLIEDINFYSGKKIQPGNTLLFLDEIQECENAVRALRYFKEDCPELHVVAAGSLLDFKIQKIGIPVGRVQYMYLNPLSFGEFLTVNGREDLREYLLKQTVSKTVHEILLKLLKTYMWVGGMTAAVNSWLTY